MTVEATLTKNGASTQLILPAHVRSQYGFEPGQQVVLEPRTDGILIRRSTPSPSFCSEVSTIGYEDRVAVAMCKELAALNIKQVVDVRELPLSRRPGFSKSVLADELRNLGIAYRHLPEMGSPRNLRHSYREHGDVGSFMDSYSKYLDTQPDTFELLRALVLSTRSALLCYEQDYHSCHRNILAQRLTNAGFRVSHL
jgi:uncharacterized protein (DUF488 family)